MITEGSSISWDRVRRELKPNCWHQFTTSFLPLGTGNGGLDCERRPEINGEGFRFGNTDNAQELCESRGGRPGLSSLISLTVSVDVKQHWIWSLGGVSGWAARCVSRWMWPDGLHILKSVPENDIISQSLSVSFSLVLKSWSLCNKVLLSYLFLCMRTKVYRYMLFWMLSTFYCSCRSASYGNGCQEKID